MLLGPDFPRYCYQKCSINGGVGLAIAKSRVKEVENAQAAALSLL